MKLGTKKGAALGLCFGIIYSVLYCAFAMSFWYGYKLRADENMRYNGGTLVQVGIQTRSQHFEILIVKTLYGLISIF